MRGTYRPASHATRRFALLWVWKWVKRQKEENKDICLTSAWVQFHMFSASWAERHSNYATRHSNRHAIRSRQLCYDMRSVKSSRCSLESLTIHSLNGREWEEDPDPNRNLSCKLPAMDRKINRHTTSLKFHLWHIHRDTLGQRVTIWPCGIRPVHKLYSLLTFMQTSLASRLTPTHRRLHGDLQVCIH